MSWAELAGVPAELLDGDQDALAALTCADDSVPSFDVSTGMWLCGADAVLSTADVLAILASNAPSLSPGTTLDGEALATLSDLEWSLLAGVPAGFADGEDADTLGALDGVCADGDRPAWDEAGQMWTCSPRGVDLARLETSSATLGQVLTFDGAAVAWADPELPGGTPCLLGTNEPEASAAEIVCGGETILVHTRAPFVQISAGSQFGCGLTVGGSLRCWGDNQWSQAVPPASGVYSQVSAGIAFACAVEEAGAIQCWGRDVDGETAPPTGAFVMVSAGNNHACAIDVAGGLACWGRNGNGQASPPAGSFLAVAVGQDYSCALDSQGAIQCWGFNLYGRASPPAGSFVALSAGDISACAISELGTLSCWGDSSYSLNSPPGGQFTTVSNASQHTCALRVDGTATCWGQGVPGTHSPLGGMFTDVSAGSSFNCGVSALLGVGRC